MSLSTQYSTSIYQKRSKVIKTQTVAEIRFSGQEIGEVSATYAHVALSNCEVSSGRVNYGGRLICTLVFADEAGKLCRIQKGAEFSHFADNESLAPAQKALCKLTCERTTVKREGSSCVVAVVIGAEISTFASAERNYISVADGAEILQETCSLYSTTVFSGESEIEDDFECNAEDVLVPSAEALVFDCNCTAGAVEISGEIYLSLLAVRDGKPVSLERVIPYKTEIACEEALLSRKAVCFAEVKEVNVNAKVNEDKGKCDTDIVFTLSFSGHYCEEEETVLVADAFSKESELNLVYAEEEALPCTDYRVYTERVGGLCATKAKVDYTCNFLSATLPRSEFVRTDGGVEGSVTAVLLYEQNGEIHSTDITLPFSVQLAGMNGELADMKLAVCGVSVRQRSEGECEAEAVLKISAPCCRRESAKYVCDITEGEAKALNDSAVSVYIPSAGDTLFMTAKKLSQSPAEIEATNPDLSYPLSGKERIVVFRAKK